MDWRKWVPRGVIGVILVALVGAVTLSNVFGARVAVPSTRVIVNRPTRGGTHALMLLQAWSVALKEGQAWSSQAAVTDLLGVDSGNETAQAGLDGRRDAWMATLVAGDKPNSQLVERIVNGVVVRSIELPSRGTAPPIVQAPVIDSDTAVRAALAARPNMQPASDNLHGYSFAVRTDQDGKPVVAVMGSYRAHPVQVEFDALTGKMLGASLYTWPETVLYSDNAGQTWQASNLSGGPVMGIASVPSAPRTAYAIEVGVNAVHLWKTSDGGHSWSIVSDLPSDAGPIAHSVAVVPLSGTGTILAAGTTTGLWMSGDGGRSWTHDNTLPGGAVQWLALGHDGAVTTLLVTVATGANQGLFASSDLRSWQMIGAGSYRFSTSSDGRVTVALSDDSPGTGYVSRPNQTPVSFTVPIPVMRVAGQLGPGSVELAEAPDRVAVSRDGGAHWSTTLDQQTARQMLAYLAVSPDFPADGVALASGQNGGMFRSADAGQTWQQVKDFPAGSGDEIGNTTFLSADQVVVVRGGSGTWQPF